MPDDLRPLRPGRYYSERELAAHALRAAAAVVGADDSGKPRPYRSRRELADALGISPSALSSALALGDPDRPSADYDRGKSTRRLILRRLAGFEVGEPSYPVEPAASGSMLQHPERA